MNELGLICNLESPQEKNSRITIKVDNTLNEDLLYRYIIGSNGTWNTLKDFSEETGLEWVPQEDGRYIIMIQAKKRNGHKSFDYISKLEYVIGKVEEKLIDTITLDKHTLDLGEKINLFVSASKYPLMFRYWLKENDEWKIIKDYSTDNTLSLVAKVEGKGQILVECKNIDSKNKFDDFQTVEFEILPLKSVEITDFKCLTKELLEDLEVIFQVDTSHEDDRTILYKFIKVNANGEVVCIQDYSTNRTVSYVESDSGKYRLLCMVKDMYSTKSFDDRAIINFVVKKYREIIIKSFTTDISSPQLCETPITLKAKVTGGKELLYRYIIDGGCHDDSGYIRNNTYVWRSIVPGNYRITLRVKDKSFDGDFEGEEYLDFTLDEQSREPVRINEVVLDKHEWILCNERVNVKVDASGGTSLRYCFIIRKDGENIEEVNYGSCSWIDFIPKEQGNYELEVRVKDKYSDRDFDCHSIINIDAYNYIPANIDYILFPFKENYLVGDIISLNVIARNTKKTIANYVLSINNHKVEETGFVEEKKYIFKPKCSGMYNIDIYVKNIDSDKIFDCKKGIKIEVKEAMPVTNTKITCDKVKFLCNESVNFAASSEGGKDIIYEFYIMEKGDWNLVQGYSKKNYYTFIPFCKEEYKVLVLAKSQYSKVSYEDYDSFTFTVE